MSVRFICPHCRVAIDPEAMETSCDAGAEFRVCPCCDTPVALAARADTLAGRIVTDTCSTPTGFELEGIGSDRTNRQEAEA